MEAFAELFRLEAGHFWFRARNQLIAWAMRRYFPDAKTALEIGCGTGFVLSHLEKTFPDIELSGGEAYPEALVFAASRLERAKLYQVDVRALPFENEFDVIGAFDVLEHVPQDEEALAQIFKATRLGGGIILTVPQHRWLWSSADDIAHHVRRYTAEELRRKVANAGFEVVRSTSFVSALLPPMLLSRMMGGREESDERVQREFEIAPPIGYAFEKVLAGERALIRAGVSLPVGGSRLLVARRTH